MFMMKVQNLDLKKIKNPSLCTNQLILALLTNRRYLKVQRTSMQPTAMSKVFRPAVTSSSLLRTILRNVLLKDFVRPTEEKCYVMCLSTKERFWAMMASWFL